METLVEIEGSFAATQNVRLLKNYVRFLLILASTSAAAGNHEGRYMLREKIPLTFISDFHWHTCAQVEAKAETLHMDAGGVQKIRSRESITGTAWAPAPGTTSDPTSMEASREKWVEAQISFWKDTGGSAY